MSQEQQIPLPGQVILELNFCERGTDFAFQINIDATKPYIDLWKEVQAHVLIPIDSFTLEHESDQTGLGLKFAESAFLKPLYSFKNVFEEGSVLTYWDDRFQPISSAETVWLSHKREVENISRMALTRPPLFLEVLKKYPTAFAQLQPPLSELYSSTDQMDVMSQEFLHLISRFVLPIDQRRTYWENQKKDRPTDPIVVEELRHVEGFELIQEQFEFAMEYTPEHFGSVPMLYVPFEINEHKVACFVDSGAQTTLISLSFAKRVGIDHLIDRRFAGKAKGVGTGDILGSIHAVKVKLGSQYLSFRFQVLTSIDLDVLLGLDNLKGHLMKINLETNSLDLSTEKIPFLSEGDITAYQKESLKLKIQFNEASSTTGGKKNIKLSEEDEYWVEKQKQKNSNSGQLVGNPGTSFKDFVKFGTDNIYDIKRALKHISDSYDFDILQHQRQTGSMARPDQELVDLYAAPFDPTNPSANSMGHTTSIQRNLDAISGLDGDVPSLNENQSRAIQGFLNLLQMAQQQQTGSASSTSPPNTHQPATVAPSQQQQQPRVYIDPSKLETLIAMGYPKQESMDALALYGNDLDLAIASLQPDDDE